MLPIDNGLMFTFFDVGGGDAIWIRYLGDDGLWHNILVDGGYANKYARCFKRLISDIAVHECIDLWIVTHPDLDHIGAIRSFMTDKKFPDKNKVLKKVWFNHAQPTIRLLDGSLGAAQGISLRKHLHDVGLLDVHRITVDMRTVNFWGLNITVISPTKEKLDTADAVWKAYESKTKLARTAQQSDHQKSIEDLKNRSNFSEDHDPWNGGAIALLIEYNGVKALLLSDSHPSPVAQRIQALGNSASMPLNLDFMQLSHHGSKANNSTALLELINTSNYVITGDGIKNQHPDKEILVRVLTKTKRSGSPINFIFPSKTAQLMDLFKVDDDPFSRYHFNCNYPSAGQSGACLTFLPLNTK